jgi:AraC-like DNA-binding protein
MSARFIPYSTLLAMNNLAFLAIYVLYVIIFISSELEQLSFRFKITGIIFVLVLAVVGIIGSLTLYQFEESYDATNRAELRYVSLLIEKRNFSQMPTHIDFIVMGGLSGNAMSVYSKDARTIAVDAIRLWEFVPGSIGLSSHKHDFAEAKHFEERKRYFTRIDDRNYHVYIVKTPPLQYGVAYSFFHYRALLHQKALRMIIILGCALLAVFVLTPFMVNIGLLQPLDAVISRIGKTAEGTQKGDEIVRVSRTLHEIIEEREALSEENIRLREEAKRKKRHDYPITGPGKNKIVQALAYIRENYRYDISREGLASSVSMSPVRFGKAFKAYTGKKFGEYINELRIEEAKSLLKETKKPISDIAFEVGFDSLRSFNRAFYRHTGMTPSQFRNQ